MKRDIQRVLKAVSKIEKILKPYKSLNKELILRVAYILYGPKRGAP